MSDGEKVFNGLVAVVQYRRKAGAYWRTMAAFDIRSIADSYAANCAKGRRRPWEYRVLEVTEIANRGKADMIDCGSPQFFARRNGGGAGDVS
jgi:hypothetical protein